MPVRLWKFIVSLGLMFVLSVMLVIYFIVATVYDLIGSLVMRLRNRGS